MLTLLAKSVLKPIGLTAEVSTTNTGIRKEILYLLIQDASKTIENEAKEGKVDILACY